MIRRLLLLTLTAVLVIGLAAAGTLYWMLSGDGVRLALERQATAWLGQPVTIGHAGTQLLPRPALALDDVRVGDALVLARVEVSARLGALLARRIEDADVRVVRSRIAMPLPFGMPAGGGTATPESDSVTPAGQGRAAAPIQVVSIRSIRLEDVVLTSRGRQITVNADSSLLRSQLQLRTFTATSGGTALEATGIVELEPRVDARLRVKANRLDVDELLALANAFSPATAPTTAAATASAGSRRTLPVRIAARISAERATAGGVDVKQFATEFQIAGDQVTLSPLTFQLFGGRFQGAIDARLADQIDVGVQTRILDIDVAQLAAFGGAANTVTGTLNGSGSFRGQGRDLSAVLASARGTGSASITNGTLTGLNLVRTVVLFFGRPEAGAPAASDRFERIDARFAVARQVVTASALSLHSADADMVGEGALTLPTGALSGRVDLSLSERLSAQAGTDLARYTREGNRIILPATIGGTLGHPRVAIDAAAALKRGLRNEVQRRLGDLLDRFKAPAP
jgi:hypothetical protein